MQRASSGGRRTPVRGSIAARRAGVEAWRWTCIAAAVLLARPVAAATFDPVTGSLSAKAGSLAATTKPAVIGSESAQSQIFIPSIALGTASLTLQNPNGNRFNFNGSAASLTQGSDAVQASYSFTQRFTTTVPQWMELTAKINTEPFGNPNATASVTLGRVGAVAAVNMGYTFGEFETRAVAFGPGNIELKSAVATSVPAGPPLDRDGQVEGSLQLYLLADFNGSGTVTNQDLATWRAGFGMTSGTFANGNLDDNPAVDGRDFLIWQRQVGAQFIAQPVGSAVPEPGACVMAAVGATAMWRLRVRRGWRIRTCGQHSQ
jgi:hypothetical protein